MTGGGVRTFADIERGCHHKWRDNHNSDDDDDDDGVIVMTLRTITIIKIVIMMMVIIIEILYLNMSICLRPPYHQIHQKEE